LIGLLGSRAVAGILSEGEILNPRGGAEQLRDALAAASLKPSQLLDAYREPEALVGFLEVHIEQLIASSADIGVVQSLVGIGSLGVTFVGRADHAGTTPMDARLDAGVGAANFMLAARQMVLDQFPNCVANVGQIVFGSGAMNIVPSTAKLGAEYRSPNQKQMVALKDALEGVAERIAEENDLRLEWEDLGAIAPTRCDQSIQDAFREACERLGLESIDLHSGAGHDTMAMAAICPAGMIFIPSTGGSHSAREHAEWGAYVQGANVLLQSVMGLADRYDALDT
jgi:N-carbamoyl-L-amino-acid hydrolase